MTAKKVYETIEKTEKIKKWLETFNNIEDNEKKN